MDDKFYNLHLDYCQEICPNKDDGKKYRYKIEPCINCKVELFALWLDEK